MSSLSPCFDAVVMLTWSDWKTEPRSNRYHFATRFARELPVLFLQPDAHPGRSISTELTEVDGVEIVHTPFFVNESEAQAFLKILRQRKIRRPLLWIYNAYYQPLIAAIPNAFRVYHATEDYFKIGSKGYGSTEHAARAVAQTVADADLLVAVTEGVLVSYRQNGGYRGPAVVSKNGCDAEFFSAVLDQLSTNPTAEAAKRPVAIYQGGINARLDFDLIDNVVHLLPEWDFWFCGKADDSNRGWRRVKSRANVRHLGALDPEALATRMCRATVGLIPFNQDDIIGVSLPLKAYEYVACGLPVVTVPIDALKSEPDLFTFARTAAEFASAIRDISGTPKSPDRLARRRDAAMRNSYDERFRVLRDKLLSVRTLAVGRKRSLNMAILYDDRSTHINTIREHLEAFRKYSRHVIYFVPVTGAWPLTADELRREIDLSLFDVLILHYSVRTSLADHLSEQFALQLERHSGIKILFVQDEYDSTETTRRWMDRLRLDIVYTCVPDEGREYVYPRERFPDTAFIPTLTGYVPEDSGLDEYATPMRDRENLIGYRGRVLPHIYGWLGYEKYRIGVDVRRFAEERQLPVDIETDDAKRIHGTDWYRFLGSVRATLGTESGSNVFDIDGSLPSAIKDLLEKSPNISFEEVHRQVLAAHEGRVTMNQVSPKIFEAIRLRTALVLFEGDYSGVVKPELHFIPLRKDYANIEEVFSKLQDFEFLDALTQRAYDDVIASGDYSYKRFVEGVDQDIDARAIRGARYELFATPAVARDRRGTVRSALPARPIGFVLSTQPLGGNLQREAVAGALWPGAMTFYWVSLEGLRTVIVGLMWKLLHRVRGRVISSPMAFRVVRMAWRVLPERLRRYADARL
jgi:hypothetical protein